MADSDRGTSLELLVEGSGGWLRAAAVENGRLTDLHCDHHHLPSWTDAVVRGRVVRRGHGDTTGIHVAVGLERSGYLDGGAAATRHPALPPLREGQTALFQIKADPPPGSRKGVSLSRDLVLAGRFLARLPYGRGIQVSRRIGNTQARAALKARLQTLAILPEAEPEQKPEQGGWIIRAAARLATSEQLQIEARSLEQRWQTLAASQDGPPGVVLPPPDAVERLLRDTASRPWQRLWLAEPVAATLAARFRHEAPDLLPHITVAEAALFERYDLEGQFAALLAPSVPLAGGGSLVITPTEALVAVDVNAGTHGNPAALNREAATVLARQIRLRNLAGMVVVDFLTPPGRDARTALEQHLAAAVAEDPAGVQIYGFTAMGLFELTRRRRGPALAALAALLLNPADGGQSAC